MFREFFSQSPVLLLPIIALGLFMSAFAAIIWRTLRGDPRRLDHDASIPLSDAEETLR